MGFLSCYTHHIFTGIRTNDLLVEGLGDCEENLPSARTNIKVGVPELEPEQTLSQQCLGIARPEQFVVDALCYKAE